MRDSPHHTSPSTATGFACTTKRITPRTKSVLGETWYQSHATLETQKAPTHTKRRDKLPFTLSNVVPADVHAVVVVGASPSTRTRGGVWRG